MNNATRVLSTKAIDEYDGVRAESRRLMLEILGMPDASPVKSVEREQASAGPIRTASFEV